jgi:hypothetical protein
MSLDITTTPPISPPTLALIPIVTATVQPTPRRFPCCPFDLGLTVDGIIRTKQGQHISVRDNDTSPSSFKPTTPARFQDHDIDRDTPPKPTYTSHLLKYNMHDLKMKYKRITQKRARLMRAIRKTHTQRQQLQQTQIDGKHPAHRKTTPSRKSRKLFHPITIPETPPMQLHPDQKPSWTLQLNDKQTFRQSNEDIQLWPVHVTLTNINNTPSPTNSHTENSTDTITALPQHTMKRNGDTEQTQPPPQEDLAPTHDKDKEDS